MCSSPGAGLYAWPTPGECFAKLVNDLVVSGGGSDKRKRHSGSGQPIQWCAAGAGVVVDSGGEPGQPTLERHRPAHDKRLEVRLAIRDSENLNPSDMAIGVLDGERLLLLVLGDEAGQYE